MVNKPLIRPLDKWLVGSWGDIPWCQSVQPTGTSGWDLWCGPGGWDMLDACYLYLLSYVIYKKYYIYIVHLFWKYSVYLGIIHIHWSWYHAVMLDEVNKKTPVVLDSPTGRAWIHLAGEIERCQTWIRMFIPSTLGAFESKLLWGSLQQVHCISTWPSRSWSTTTWSIWNWSLSHSDRQQLHPAIGQLSTWPQEHQWSRRRSRIWNLNHAGTAGMDLKDGIVLKDLCLVIGFPGKAQKGGSVFQPPAALFFFWTLWIWFDNLNIYTPA